MDNLIQDEVVKNLDEIDESLEEICDNGQEFLFRIPEMVKKAEKMYLNLAGENLSGDQALNPYLKAHQDAHCSLINNKEKEKWFQTWMKENAGENAMLYTQIAGVTTVVGAGIAGMAGCIPCLYYAAAGGAAFAGIGTYETLGTDSEADALIGLSQLGLADHDKARETLTEARAGWVMVGIDAVTAPFVGGGKLIQLSKLVKKGSKTLKGSELGKDKLFLKSLAQGLPKDEYLKTLEALKNLPAPAQEQLSKQLAKTMASVKESERFALIKKTLDGFKVPFPEMTKLNAKTLTLLESDPKKLIDIEKRYTSALKAKGIDPTSQAGKTHLRIIGVLENQGCNGVCRKALKTEDEVMAEADTLLKKNGCSL